VKAWAGGRHQGPTSSSFRPPRRGGPLDTGGKQEAVEDSSTASSLPPVSRSRSPRRGGRGLLDRRLRAASVERCRPVDLADMEKKGAGGGGPTTGGGGGPTGRAAPPVGGGTAAVGRRLDARRGGRAQSAGRRRRRRPNGARCPDCGRRDRSGGAAPRRSTRWESTERRETAVAAHRSNDSPSKTLRGSSAPTRDR